MIVAVKWTETSYQKNIAVSFSLMAGDAQSVFDIYKGAQRKMKERGVRKKGRVEIKSN